MVKIKIKMYVLYHLEMGGGFSQYKTEELEFDADNDKPINLKPYYKDIIENGLVLQESKNQVSIIPPHKILKIIIKTENKS